MGDDLVPFPLTGDDPVGEASRRCTSEHGPRPAGPADRCFCCLAPVGDDHLADCVCRQRLVEIEVTLRLSIAVPEAWTQDQIEFRHNESTWCWSNLADELAAAVDRNGRCLCGSASMRWVRDAG